MKIKDLSFMEMIIKNHYFLPKDFQVQILREGPDNDVFLIKNKQGKKTAVVRVNKRDVGKDIFFEIAWLKKLKDKKIPVPKIIPTKNGQDFVIDQKGQVYVAFEYAGGTHLEIRPNLKPKPIFVGKAAEALADMHNASLDIAVNISRKRNIFTEINRALKISDKFIKFSEGGEKFVKELKYYKKWAEENTNNDYLIHNDFRPGNIFYKGNKVSAILDFDWSCKGPAIKDVAHALAEWSFLDGAKKHWQDVFDTFLKSYNQEAKNKIKLDNTLYRWICFSCLSDAATYLSDLASENTYKKITSSYMYQKFLYFEKLTI